MRTPLIYSRFLVLIVLIFQTTGCKSPEESPQQNSNSATQELEVKTTLMPVVIDSDMGFDDWMAILYVLKREDVEVKAITVDCTGETGCPAGAVNATKLLVLAGKPDIPVYYGDIPAATLDYQFPAAIRSSATAMNVPGFNDITGTSNYQTGAANALVSLATQAGKANKPITILSIGTATNIAQAVEQATDQELFENFAKGIQMIYKGGGAIGAIENGVLTNKNIPGNLNIPGLFTTNNTTAAWNIYANAQAASKLFTSGLPITQVPVNLSNQVAITENSYNLLKENATSQAAKFVVSDIITNVNDQGGFAKEELDYWDPSEVVAALNPSFINSKFQSTPVCVAINEIPFHGTTFVNGPFREITICDFLNATPGEITIYMGIDTAKFYSDFAAVLNQ